MTEMGARPKVSPMRRGVLNGLRVLFTPLLPDDYLELIDPLWSTRELRGRVERLEAQPDGAVTVHIRPGFAWAGHRPGQYVRLAVVVDGRHHWRVYSLTSDPHAPDGLISITPKRTPDGVVSPYLTGRLRVGDVVRLGEVEGTFTLPEPVDGPLLFVTAGSGVTPVYAMLRWLAGRGELTDVVMVHSARSAEQVIFGDELGELGRAHPGLTVHLWESGRRGRIDAAAVAALCPDWAQRHTYACGPGELLDGLATHWNAAEAGSRLHTERFQPVVGTGDGSGSTGDGGHIRFPRRNLQAECPPGVSLLVAGERAGVRMPFGCRMGVCHTCIVRIRSGSVRDLRSNEVRQVHQETVRTCIHAPEGDVEIDL